MNWRRAGMTTVDMYISLHRQLTAKGMLFCPASPCLSVVTY